MQPDTTAAKYPRQDNMAARSHGYSRFTGMLLALVVTTLLTACGGGAETISQIQDSRFNNNGGGTAPPVSTGVRLSADMQGFKSEFWQKLSPANRCGGACHSTGQTPKFVATDIALAYTTAVGLVDLSNPANSRVVAKVGGGHNCWLASNADCATEMTRYVEAWANGPAVVEARAIELEAPELKDADPSKNYPLTALDNDPASFAKTVYPLLTAYCNQCHADSSPTPQAPFFASADVEAAYAAAKTKMDLNIPENSRLVIRLRDEAHNCWDNNCPASATQMQEQIAAFAGPITPTAVNSAWVTSKALSLADGIIASGGARYEGNLIALWEFKEGTGRQAFDSSGVVSVDGDSTSSLSMTMTGNVTWVAGYGVAIGNGGKLQASTAASSKLRSFINASESYSIEAWVVPANVTQEEASIITYSSGVSNRNMMLGQTLYNYDFYNRSEATIVGETNNIDPVMSTPNGDENLQAALQHVVATYNPNDGRKIYVNGELTNATDEAAAAFLADNPGSADVLRDRWTPIAALVFGNEPSGANQWLGKIRLVAIHNRELTQDQIKMNFEAGVGQKYLLLFSVAESTGVDDTYIMFEVTQYDDYSYFFNKPTFLSLNADWTPPASYRIRGMRLGINGKEAAVGQVYANLDVTVDSSSYAPGGQLLSELGTIIALETGAETDTFFLTFEIMADDTFAHVEPAPVIPTPGPDAEAVADIGIRTFEEIHNTMSQVTGIPVSNTAVKGVFDNYKQQLPTISDMGTFLSSHQMAIAQLAMTYCDELVSEDLTRASADRFFAGFNFGRSALSAFDTTSRSQIITPLLAAMINVDGAKSLATQPAESVVRGAIGGESAQTLDAGIAATYSSLIDEMLSRTGAANACPAYVAAVADSSIAVEDRPNCVPDTTARTREIVTASCTALLGSATMLIK